MHDAGQTEAVRRAALPLLALAVAFAAGAPGCSASATAPMNLGIDVRLYG
jgi:hypothetical protein